MAMELKGQEGNPPTITIKLVFWDGIIIPVKIHNNVQNNVLIKLGVEVLILLHKV